MTNNTGTKDIGHQNSKVKLYFKVIPFQIFPSCVDLPQQLQPPPDCSSGKIKMVTVVLAVLEERREADLMLPWSLAAADGVNSVIAVVDEGGLTGNDEGPTIPMVAPRPSCSPIKTKKNNF